MRPVDFVKVKELVSWEKVIDLIGWRPRWKEPSGFRGPCPLHASTNPNARTFAVSAEGWYCWRCKRGGGHVELYALVYGLKPIAAAVELCQRAGVDVPYLPRRPRQPRPPRSPRER